ncbi:amidohydrolase family protein [Streptomyces boninensis]|uniref:amidohydrolase family protein n=1 Tax=Streptomyces boninensis TaxID=2039455 RepID=UPI003B21F131
MINRRQLLGTAGAVAGAALVGGPAGAGAHAADRSRGSGQGRRPLALTHATVVDGARTHADRTILIAGDRVVTVEPSAAVPAGARVVDVRGKYVIPGLVEAHVHTSGPEEIMAPLFPLTGVTAVREMWGQPVHHEWRRKVDTGRLLGPRWVIASPILDGPPTLFTNDTGGEVIEVTDEASARRAVRRVAREGADFVKVYSRLSRRAHAAIADEARRRGLRIAGHCPDALTIAECADAGQQSIEHLHALLLATATPAAEREIRRGLARVRLDPREPSSLERYNAWFRQVHVLEYEAVRHYDRDRARELFDRLAARGTRVVPTLSVHHSLERPEELPTGEEEWKYLPDWMVGEWPGTWKTLTANRTSRDAAMIRRIYAHRLHLVEELHRSGVPLLAGTDTGTGYLVPGFSLHGELELLAEAGLPARDVLDAATTAPARMLGLPEHRADLVVLDANPLADIRNTRRIDSVVTAGRYLGREDRKRELAAVARAAAESQPPAGPAAAAARSPRRCC